jgi:DNA-binding IclR family transcriptional regulator
MSDMQVSEAGTDEDGASINEGNSGGVQAIETGIRLLEALMELGPTPMLKTLAEKSGMPPPKAHRYLSSFCKSGLVERYGDAGGYRLGPMALQMGLAVLRHMDVVSLATPAVTHLRDTTGFTSALSVWGSYGPTFVKLVESLNLVVVTTRPGTVMPLLSTSTGRVFGAYLPRSTTQHLIDRELKQPLPRPIADANRISTQRRWTLKEVEAEFEQVRRDRMAFNRSGEYREGINAMAAPVLNHEGQVAAVITVWGEAAVFDISSDGPVAQRLRETTRLLSQQMGWNEACLA